MSSHENRVPVSPVAPLVENRVKHKADFKGTAKPAGGIDMEPRITQLETHLKYICRDLAEVRGDVKAIKHRLAYSAGAAAVLTGLLGWVANSRFDQLVSLMGQ